MTSVKEFIRVAEYLSDLHCELLANVGELGYPDEYGDDGYEAWANCIDMDHEMLLVAGKGPKHGVSSIVFTGGFYFGIKEFENAKD